MRSEIPASLAVLLLLAGAIATPAAAQEITWPATMYNPTPAPDDVVLPMPCGGAMTFRRVVTGSVPDARTAALGDKRITLGSERPDGRNISDFRRDEHVAGPFENEGERYYLIGKYEVTEPQWLAVLGDGCPDVSPWALFPKNEVNWYDGIAFTRAYNAWLADNAAEVLPLAPAGRAFVRLPTDAEWEFAARGGLAVADSERGADMFELGDLPLANFAWLSSPETGTEVQPIGAKQPNPLGLHDVIGNVEEIVLDAFRMNRVGRLHGQVGGFTARGGSLRTDPQFASLAFREEFAFYETNGAGEVRRDTLGFRLVVGAAAIGGYDNFERLDNAFEAVRETGGENEPPSADERLEEIAREEAEALRRQLESAVSRLEETAAERAAVEERRAELERLVDEQSSRLERRLSELRAQLQSEAARRAEAEARNAEAMLMSALVLLNELDKTALFIALFTEDARLASSPEEAAEIMADVRDHVGQFEDVGLAYTDVLMQLSSDLGARLDDAVETLGTELRARGQDDTFQPLLARAVPHVEAFRDGRLDARTILRIVAEEAREVAGRL